MPAFVPVCLIAASLLLLFSLPALVQRKLHLGVVFPTAVSLTLFLYAGSCLRLSRYSRAVCLRRRAHGFYRRRSRFCTCLFSAHVHWLAQSRCAGSPG